ncbi:MAG: von Willebrand factor type A domain-containing protein [Acidobacteriota bacterium]
MRMQMIVLMTIATVAAMAATGATPRLDFPTPAAPVDTQASTTIIGSVVDVNLAPVTGARVVLERAGRAVMTTTSDAGGQFRLERVAPGACRVRVSLAGFNALVRDLTVPSGASSVRLPLVLVRPSDRARDESAGLMNPDAKAGRAGGAGMAVPPPPPPSAAVASPGTTRSESVSVTAEAPLIQAQSGERSVSVKSQQVENLPMSGRGGFAAPIDRMSPMPERGRHQPSGTNERYAHAEPGAFHRAADDPLSTFGADVDTASFANVRRLLHSGQRPPADAVRVEEFINYFHYAYPTPRTGHPIGLTTEVGDCPWAPSHKLVLIGARAIPSSTRTIEGRNFVLLIDVSGSMSSQDKLPLLKAAFNMFVDTLRPDDRIAIVTYAGYSGLALPSTPAREQQTIRAAIDRLGAGGSTNGGQGIIQAYRVAREAFIPGGVNRVILATDGDFNVGIVGQTDLLTLIQREKESGVFLSVFGVGTGNIKDDTMEMLADKGNGQYAYLDTLQEARRVLVTESDATLETVAKDTKFQVEFNPTRVAAWKLIGYENRLMAAEDFNNDRKDGGELGAGHTVTVLYEVVPVGAALDDESPTRPRVDPLNYQPPSEPSASRPARGAASPEWLTVKVRYQQPEGDQSRLIQLAVTPGDASRPAFLPFASAVAEFGLLLKDERDDRERWSALTRRLSSMMVTPQRAADRDQILELVELAKATRR